MFVIAILYFVQSIFSIIRPNKIKIFSIITDSLLRVIGLQITEQILMILKCDNAEIHGDYTLRLFEGERAAKLYW